MSNKDDERIIGEIFIDTYNSCNGYQFSLDYEYLYNRPENDFPDLKFVNGKELLAEVVRAVCPEIQKGFNDHENSELIEVDPYGELFIAINKKVSKYYSNAENIILLIHLPFYTEISVINSLVTVVINKHYKFREIWAVWEDPKQKPIKLS